MSEPTANDADLAEIVRLHGLWLVGEPSGKRADLTGADLTGAYLTGADLSGADLTGADLTGADLSGADLSGAKGIMRIGPARDGYEFFAVRRDGAVWIKAGCRWFVAAEARAHWSKPREDEALQAERLRFLDFLEANCPED